MAMEVHQSQPTYQHNIHEQLPGWHARPREDAFIYHQDTQDTVLKGSHRRVNITPLYRDKFRVNTDTLDMQFLRANQLSRSAKEAPVNAPISAFPILAEGIFGASLNKKKLKQLIFLVLMLSSCAAPAAPTLIPVPIDSSSGPQEGIQSEFLPAAESVETAPYTATLSLTDFWDRHRYIITPVGNSATIQASLFLEKHSEYNYGRHAGILDNTSVLMWNSIEAIQTFGSMSVRPGDKIVLTNQIDMYDDFITGESVHGDGYVNAGDGMCLAATVLGEILGTEIVLSDGTTVPVFIAQPGAIQEHNEAIGTAYQSYLYHGPGVGINRTAHGTMPFMVNPNLPIGLVLNLSLSYTDSNPSAPHDGIYKPTVTLAMTGLPDNSQVVFQRLSANRTEILQRITGTDQYWNANAGSAYFSWDGNPIISTQPFSFLPSQATENTIHFDQTTNVKNTQLNRFTMRTDVPADMYNPTYNPGGFANRSVIDDFGNRIWNMREDWFPIHPDDLPPAMTSYSADEYRRILSWNNVSNPENLRYVRNDGNRHDLAAMLDWAQAFRTTDYMVSAPLPRWLDSNRMTINVLFDWLRSYEAETLGWKAVSATEAQQYANEGYLSLGIAKNHDGPGRIVAVAPGAGWTDSATQKFYPTIAQAGEQNWGPNDGATALNSFYYDPNDLWADPVYYVWIP